MACEALVFPVVSVLVAFLFVAVLAALFVWRWHVLASRFVLSADTLIDRRKKLYDYFTATVAELEEASGDGWDPSQYRIVIDSFDIPLFESLVREGKVPASMGYWMGIEVVSWRLDAVKGEHCSCLVRVGYEGLDTAVSWLRKDAAFGFR